MRQEIRNSILFLVLVVGCLQGQTSPKDDAKAQALKNDLTNAASAGTPLPAAINVRDNVNIEAVMLPRDVSRRVFGKEIADRYAVIEVNISNRSNDAGLIVQSLFIDLSGWVLAGPMGPEISAAGIDRSGASLPYQTNSSSRQVSSVEYRIVRGEALDRQPWTARNVALRTMQTLGSIGTAFAFPFTKDVVAGINAWNGGVVPGFQTMFPDGTIQQLDRISDYGFRNNKVIPQQAADILVAFFPIDRFLPPSLKDVFLNTPSLFFNPLLMLIDPKTRPLLSTFLAQRKYSQDQIDREIQQILDAYGTMDQAGITSAREQLDEDAANIAHARKELEKDQAAVDQDKRKPDASQAVIDAHKAALAEDRQNLDKYKAARENDNRALQALLRPLTGLRLYNVLNSVSLNHVKIVLSGIMTVDVDNVPAIITSIDCTDPPAVAWGTAGDHNCAIHGSFLSNGTPVIAEATDLGLNVGAVSDGSTDALLNIKVTVKNPIKPKTVLTFQVTKKNKQGNTVESMKFPYTVPDYTATPAISGVEFKDNAVTVTGANFQDSAGSAVSVKLHRVSAPSVPDQNIAKPTVTATQIKFDFPSASVGCWQVQVNVGNVQTSASTDKPPKDQFAVPPTPVIKTAVLKGSTLTATGTGLVDLADCGTPLKFEALSSAKNATAKPITAKLLADGTQATFDMPALDNGTKWKELHTLLNGKQVSNTPITSQ
jgi:hypothetical protein